MRSPEARRRGPLLASAPGLGGAGVVALLLLHVMLGDAASAPDESSAPKLSIDILAPHAWHGAPLHLRARLDAPRPARYRWEVSDGELLDATGELVVWIAPAASDGPHARLPSEERTERDAPGPSGARVVVTVEAELLGAGEPPVRRELEVTLAPPSLDGMARVPGGEYTIGDTWTDTDAPDFVLTNQNKADKPAHRVRLAPFAIGRDRVTNDEYVEFLNDALDRGLLTEVTETVALGLHRGAVVPFFRLSYGDLAPELAPKLRRAVRFDGDRFYVRGGSGRHPVVDVTWSGADAFASWRGHRLATNAEWEAAARGRDGRRYPWGDELPTRRHANVNGFYGNRLFPVGSFSPAGDSPFGVRDTTSALFEWVHDWYGETYYSDVASESPVVNPTGPHWGKDRVIRGVPYTHGISGMRHEQPPLSFRYAWFFEFPLGDGVATRDTGFRTAVSLPGAEAPEGSEAAEP